MPTLTPEMIFWAILAVVPGYICYRVYSLRFPSERLDPQKHLAELFTYSCINAGCWYWLIEPILSTPKESWDLGYVTRVAILVCFLSPAALALMFVQLRSRVLPYLLGMDHPTPKAWDYFIEKNREFYVLFHLKDGNKMGGYFGSKSYASAFPQEPEIYVESVIKVTREGEFKEWVEGSKGAVVRESEWTHLEFLEIPDPQILKRSLVRRFVTWNKTVILNVKDRSIVRIRRIYDRAQQRFHRKVSDPSTETIRTAGTDGSNKLSEPPATTPGRVWYDPPATVSQNQEVTSTRSDNHAR